MMETSSPALPMDDRFIRQAKKKAVPVEVPLWLKIVVGIILVFAGMMLYVWKNIEVSHLAWQISTLKKQKEYLINENKSLEVEIASLSHLARIEQIAKDEIGLVYPATYPIVFKMTPMDQEPPGFLANLGIGKLKEIVREVKVMVLPSAEADPRNSGGGNHAR